MPFCPFLNDLTILDVWSPTLCTQATFISVIIVYLGTAGDSFAYHDGAPFTTEDQDNDNDGGNCAVTFQGGWWYYRCRNANLNGLYHHGIHSTHADGINWYDWKGDYYSARRSEMKVRPADF